MDLLAHQKDDEAYRFLYAQYQHVLLKFAWGYIRTKEPAEEIVNDVLYKVWAKKESISEISNLRLYLFTAVRNSCLTYLARAKKERDCASRMPFDDCCLESPESIIISSEFNTYIKEAVNALPPRCRQIYELIRIDGLKNKDVAKQLDISVNTIDAQLAIALKRLVKKVADFRKGDLHRLE